MGYMRRPKIIKTLKLKGPVTGVTVYKEEIFITRHESTTIDAFNSTTFKRSQPISTSENKRKFPILRMIYKTQKSNGLQDITSCWKKGFIYVGSWQDCIIHRIDTVSRSVCGSWEVKNGDPTTLSVTKYGNLLVSCASDGKVLEYTSEGELVHEINFACNGEGPLHAVHLTNERFAACHGRRDAVRVNDGVTITDKYGNVIPEVKPLVLSQSCHLTIDSNNNVLIAARGRSKLTLWNPIKGTQRVLISLDQEIEVPTRIHLDESTGQLLMLFQSETLKIYQVKSAESNAANNDCEDD